MEVYRSLLLVKFTPDFLGIMLSFYFIELTFKLAMNATSSTDDEGMF